MQWLSTSIQRRIETLATVEVQIAQARETLTKIKRGDVGGGGDPVGDLCVLNI